MSKMPRPHVVAPDGTKMYLDQLPLVTFRLGCGHVGKDYGLRPGDVYFCEECKADTRVAELIAT